MPASASSWVSSSGAWRPRPQVALMPRLKPRRPGARYRRRLALAALDQPDAGGRRASRRGSPSATSQTRRAAGRRLPFLRMQAVGHGVGKSAKSSAKHQRAESSAPVYLALGCGVTGRCSASGFSRRCGATLRDSTAQADQGGSLAPHRDHSSKGPFPRGWQRQGRSHPRSSRPLPRWSLPGRCSVGGRHSERRTPPPRGRLSVHGRSVRRPDHPMDQRPLASGLLTWRLRPVTGLSNSTPRSHEVTCRVNAAGG
jgi:hypothetical protein